MRDNDIPTGPRVKYFEQCRCPHCKFKLDDVPTSAERCPGCDEALDVHDVWSTRRYSGMITLPTSVTAFGWPVLMMAAGVGVIVATYAGSAQTMIVAPVGLIGTGFVWFMFKLFGGDDD